MISARADGTVPPERLHDHGIGQGVADGGVAGDGLHLEEGFRVGALQDALLNPPVLVAEGNLQAEDLFAVALEAEMPRLDDPCVDRSHRHLVDLLPLHPVVVGVTRHFPA